MIYLLLTTKLFGSAITSAIQSGVLHYKVTPDKVCLFVCVCVCMCVLVCMCLCVSVFNFRCVILAVAQSDYLCAHIVNICYICCPIAAFWTPLKLEKIYLVTISRWLIFLLQLAFLLLSTISINSKVSIIRVSHLLTANIYYFWKLKLYYICRPLNAVLIRHNARYHHCFQTHVVCSHPGLWVTWQNTMRLDDIGLHNYIRISTASQAVPLLPSGYCSIRVLNSHVLCADILMHSVNS